MIAAEMYGMIPIPKIVDCPKLPPLKVETKLAIRLNAPPWAACP